MSVAQPDDVAARLAKTFTAAEDLQVQVLLDDVETMIATRASVVTLDPDVLTKVEAWAVIRYLQNPEGARSYSRQIDDYSATVTIDSGNAASGLYITNAEWEELLPTNSPTGAFEIVLGGE